MKQIKRLTNACLLLCFALACQSSLQAAFTSVVDTNSGDLHILRDGQKYINFSYYDWGPGWSGVQRKQSISEVDGSAQFVFNNELRNTKAPFTITGSWAQPSAEVIRFDAELVPEKDSELVLSQFALGAGPVFDGGSVAIERADGSSETLEFPLGKGSMGDDVTKLTLTDSEGAVTVIVFDNPTSIPLDGQARLAIASGSFQAGKTETLGFSM